MTATFLVELEVDSLAPEELVIDAADLLEACEKGGLSVLSAKPWQRQAQAVPSLGQTIPPSVG